MNWFERIVISLFLSIVVVTLYSVAEANSDYRTEHWGMCIVDNTSLTPCKLVQDKGVIINGVLYGFDVIADVIEVNKVSYMLIRSNR